ncbi:MAG TPA: cobaltochelatase subunit CobN [Pyrinomonadaceae bacterium]|nr:cobaltochelatase subunit CobN [Pyrinomonadaceae bacterium]
MKVTVFYIGSSLLAPLKSAEREINRDLKLGLEISAHNFGAPLSEEHWVGIERDLSESEVVFVIHVMDSENAARLIELLDTRQQQFRAVVVINCMPDLMRRTRMGKLDFGRFGSGNANAGDSDKTEKGASSARRLLGTVGSWLGNQARARSKAPGHTGDRHTRYLKLADRLPGLLRFVPNTGALRDVKNYLSLFCYFLQPTPENIQSMILSALMNYVVDDRLKKAKLTPPATMPSVAIYHPDAPKMFESFESYAKWYSSKSRKSGRTVDQGGHTGPPLQPDATVGLLLMRPQVISKAAKHYDDLIRTIEAEGLSVIPVLATLMDNREACEQFFVESSSNGTNTSKTKDQSPKTKSEASRISQLVSLTGFSFVGGPAMNDSEAASQFLTELNRPYRSAVSLDMQTIESWRASQTGLNPVQAGMQIAIPEVDGATEPFIYGGIPANGVEPVALEDRSRRFARRLRRWNRLRTAPRSEVKLAFVVYCFPPNKGNIGTAADLDVFPSLWDTLVKLKGEGYRIDVPDTADDLRELLLRGNSDTFAATANVAYRLKMDEYHRICPYVDEIEQDWGPAPGNINSFGGELLIQGITLGNAFIGVQPTFGYEGDPMRLMMARSGAPHHGFMAFYSYLQEVFSADAVVHVGTHGAMEFMPGKQVGMSGECWPDRLIGALPNIYIYSVNNPSEGSIAKRRSYAELISYLTPPIENAGLYKDLATLKELVMAYRQTNDEQEMARIFESIEHYSSELNLSA